MAWRQIFVGRRIRTIWNAPLVIEIRQLITILIFFRILKCQGGEFNGERILFIREGDSIGIINGLTQWRGVAMWLNQLIMNIQMTPLTPWKY